VVQNFNKALKIRFIFWFKQPWKS